MKTGPFNDLAFASHEMARAKGWYDGAERTIPELLCLVHSEVSEALEAYRNGDDGLIINPTTGKPEGFESEIADVIIRVADMAAFLGIDIDAAIEAKMAYNATRPYRHGGKRS